MIRWIVLCICLALIMAGGPGWLLAALAIGGASYFIYDSHQRDLRRVTDR